MTKISNYNELVAERLKVENEILEHRMIIKESFSDLKEKFAPFLFLLPLLKMFQKKNGNDTSIWKVATSLGIDLVGQKLLSKASWFTKLVVPLFLKGVSGRAFRSSKDSNAAQELPESNNGIKR